MYMNFTFAIQVTHSRFFNARIYSAFLKCIGFNLENGWLDLEDVVFNYKSVQLGLKGAQFGLIDLQFDAKRTIK